MATPRLNRVRLSQAPTPLQRLERLSAHTGVDFWMKRDDLTGDIGLGGNKVRKLEYLLGEALAAGATHVLTTGGPQSNHARATAAACARLGLGCVLVLAGRDPGARQGNLLLDQLYGAEIRFPGAVTPADQARALDEAAAEVAAAGGRPYVITVGGSTALGSVGSYECYAEMAEALPPGTWVCTTTGSGGTHAGLALGAVTLGPAGVRVQGFSVWQPTSVLEPLVRGLVTETAALLQADLPPTFDVHVDDGYLAPRYGKANEAGLAAIALVARLEGILLDHVYTGKAMAGVLDYVRRGVIPAGSRVVFVHTGGAPAVFGGMG
ncbi:MAG TPA: D-cysteine desulfhydrase family protein [Symbiobacteriaceae bacterium]|nr:D-cysteine desulfhydrase family protein [Symbiobacteriaceae bacterium]